MLTPFVEIEIIVSSRSTLLMLIAMSWSREGVVSQGHKSDTKMWHGLLVMPML